jgi:hypothetical protein
VYVSNAELLVTTSLQSISPVVVISCIPVTGTEMLCSEVIIPAPNQYRQPLACFGGKCERPQLLLGRDLIAPSPKGSSGWRISRPSSTIHERRVAIAAQEV